jgi:Uma2 family endonuclease
MKEKDDLELREPVIAYGKKTFSIEEYLAYENASPEKHEYYHGEIFAMAGASMNHVCIERNLLVELGNALRNSPCQPYGSNFRLHIPSNTLYTYPDLTVICGDPFAMMPNEQSASLPTVIIEVLSPSTRNYDRDFKFKLYQEISTLKEYILVDSIKISIDIYRKTSEGRWKLIRFNSKSAKLEIKALKLLVLISDIYRGTNLQHIRAA